MKLPRRHKFHGDTLLCPTKTCFRAKAAQPLRGEDQEELAALATSCHHARTCLEPQGWRLTSQRILKDFLHPSLTRFFT